MICSHCVHEVPDGEKMAELGVFLKNLGYAAKGLRHETHPMALQTVLGQVKGTQHENIIGRIMLRSMKKAKYSPVNVGHFGLAARHYCHFTSPIRRYPDLMVHRMIRSALQGNSPDAYEGVAELAALQSSSTERTAMEAERAVDDLKMTEYMSAHLGEEYDGVISGVTEFGIFVELPNLIEGLIRMNELQDDYYDLDKKAYCLIGRHTGRRLNLGDKMRVRVARRGVVLVDVALSDAVIRGLHVHGRRERARAARLVHVEGPLAAHFVRAAPNHRRRWGVIVEQAAEVLRLRGSLAGYRRHHSAHNRRYRDASHRDLQE
jgi:ribonuclease R